jgi:hypothetical protein
MVNLTAKALVVDSTLKVHFFDKTTWERVPMWDKENVSLQDFFAIPPTTLVVGGIVYSLTFLLDK